MSHLIERNLGTQQVLSKCLCSGQLSGRPYVWHYSEYRDNETLLCSQRAYDLVKEMHQIHQLLKRNHSLVRWGEALWRKWHLNWSRKQVVELHLKGVRASAGTGPCSSKRSRRAPDSEGPSARACAIAGPQHGWPSAKWEIKLNTEMTYFYACNLNNDHHHFHTLESFNSALAVILNSCLTLTNSDIMEKHQSFNPVGQSLSKLEWSFTTRGISRTLYLWGFCCF